MAAPEELVASTAHQDRVDAIMQLYDTSKRHDQRKILETIASRLASVEGDVRVLWALASKNGWI